MHKKRGGIRNMRTSRTLPLKRKDGNKACAHTRNGERI